MLPSLLGVRFGFNWDVWVSHQDVFCPRCFDLQSETSDLSYVFRFYMSTKVQNILSHFYLSLSVCLSVSLSICVYICVCVCPSVCVGFLCSQRFIRSVSVNWRLNILLIVLNLTPHTSDYTSLSLSVSVWLSVCLSVWLQWSVCLSVHRQSVGQ